jgi:hypothetical protein
MDVPLTTMPTIIPEVEFHYDPDHDTNDGKPWSDMDIEYLVHELKHGGTIETTARLLCRWGTRDEVRKKAVELDLL